MVIIILIILFTIIKLEVKQKSALEGPQTTTNTLQGKGPWWYWDDDDDKDNDDNDDDDYEDDDTAMMMLVKSWQMMFGLDVMQIFFVVQKSIIDTKVQIGL